MPMIKLDFSQAGDNPGEGRNLIPEGIHDAICKNVEIQSSRNDPAKKMFVFTMIFPANGNEERKLYNMINAGDNNTYLKSSLVALGQTVPKGELTFDPEALKGKKCKAKIKHEQRQGTGDYAGRTFTDDKIAILYPVDGVPVGAAGGDGVIDLSGGGGGGTSAPSVDTIPF